MAIKKWISTDGNYDNPNSWSPVNVPVNNDTVVFDDSAQSVTSGLDQSMIIPANVYVLRGYTGKIGSSGSPLKYSSVAFNVTIQSSGTECWIDGVFSNLTCDPTLYEPNACVVSGTSISILSVLGGNSRIDSSQSLNSSVIIQGSSPICTIDSGVTLTDTRIVVNNGILALNGKGTSLQVVQNGGIVDFNTPTAAEGIKWLYQSGGIFNFLGTGLIEDAVILGGLFDESAQTNLGAILTMWAYNNATIRFDNGMGGTQPGIFFRFGTPKITYDPNK